MIKMKAAASLECEENLAIFLGGRCWPRLVLSLILLRHGALRVASPVSVLTEIIYIKQGTVK